MTVFIDDRLPVATKITRSVFFTGNPDSFLRRSLLTKQLLGRMSYFMETGEKTDLPNWNELIVNLRELDTGQEHAGEYEKLIEKILSALFYPSLCNPTKQHKIHEGRKRIDITYTNESRLGFFAWLSQHYSSSFIFVECKNYGKEIGNPEVDQIAGRFSPSRGVVGVLVCRSVDNPSLLERRCIDTAKDQRGYILV